MIHLTQIVNKVLNKKGIKFYGQDRIRTLERKINNDRQESVLSEVMGALEREFSSRFDRKDYEEIEKTIGREMKKVY